MRGGFECKGCGSCTRVRFGVFANVTRGLGLGGVCDGSDSDDDDDEEVEEVEESEDVDVDAAD